jgi:pilin isopeptide linkage protein
LSEKHFAVSDVDGKATFNLVFSESDIGKTYSYKVYEVNDGRENVEYSTVVYDVTISITLGDDNKLYATVTKGEETVDKAVCEFENIYNETPPAKPGDSAKTVLWTIALGISAFGFAATMYYGKRKKEEQDA